MKEKSEGKIPSDSFYSCERSIRRSPIQRSPSVVEDSHASPLDWYFSHDHAILDGDNNAVPMRATNVSPEQDMRMVMQELERERLDQLNANSSAQQLGGVHPIDAASIPCQEPRPSCDR